MLTFTEWLYDPNIESTRDILQSIDPTEIEKYVIYLTNQIYQYLVNETKNNQNEDAKQLSEKVKECLSAMIVYTKNKNNIEQLKSLADEIESNYVDDSLESYYENNYNQLMESLMYALDSFSEKPKHKIQSVMHIISMLRNFGITINRNLLKGLTLRHAPDYKYQYFAKGANFKNEIDIKQLFDHLEEENLLDRIVTVQNNNWTLNLPGKKLTAQSRDGLIKAITKNNTARTILSKMFSTPDWHLT